MHPLFGVEVYYEQNYPVLWPQIYFNTRTAFWQAVFLIFHIFLGIIAVFGSRKFVNVAVLQHIKVLRTFMPKLSDD